MEPNIPVGSEAGVDARHEARGRRRRARAARGRQRQVGRPLEDGPHRPAGVGEGRPGQSARPRVPAAHLHRRRRATASTLLEPAPRTVRGARDLLSVALQYGNAFGQGLQAAALKPADFFGNDDVLYLMEDMATGEIRLSILWEWLHKGARADRRRSTRRRQGGRRVHAGAVRAAARGGVREAAAAPSNRDVHDDSKDTTLPIAREIVETYVTDEVKLPWYIDLLNINLGNHDLAEARRRIALPARGLSNGRTTNHGKPRLDVEAIACRAPGPKDRPTYRYGSASRIASARWIARRPVACRICSRQLKPSDTISVSGAARVRRAAAPLADRLRDRVFVGVEAERSGHAAAAGIERLQLRAHLAQQRLLVGHFHQRLVMTVAVQQRPSARACGGVYPGAWCSRNSLSRNV